MRTSAGHWLEMAVRVYDYRRDQLSAAELGELTQKTEGLRRQLREGDDASKLKLGIEAREDVLRRAGGAIYPKSSLVENVEFFLVAAIVILGIRTYFVQPFKIPTNSMWPSYNGMTGEVFKSTAEEPGYVAQGFRFLAQLATPQRIDAPAEGEVVTAAETAVRSGNSPAIARSAISIWSNTTRLFSRCLGPICPRFPPASAIPACTFTLRRRSLLRPLRHLNPTT